MKKKILISLYVFLGLIGLFAIYLFIDPDLPNHTDQVIAEITNKKIPELVDGETGYAKSGSVNIWYQINNKSINNKSINNKGTVLLINGFKEPSTSWNQTFIKSIIDAGYRVVRFDNRDVGFSDWIENWDKSNPYTIEDMMADAIAVLDQNGIEKFHVVGYSMGGYIAQRIALTYPNRVLSLTALSSTAYLYDKGHPETDSMPLSLIKLLLRFKLIGDNKSGLKVYFKAYQIANGNDSYDMDLNLLGERGLYEFRKRRGFNFNAEKQQRAAMKNSRSIYNELSNIKIPALIVHGNKDPFTSFELAKKYSEKIENSKKIWIEGAGHVITNDYVSKFSPDFFKMLEENQP